MGQPDDRFGDEDYPAYTMGAAAEMIGVTPDFLRRLDQAKLFTPLRSAGGHRRYSRYQLRLAARAREGFCGSPRTIRSDLAARAVVHANAQRRGHSSMSIERDVS